MDFMELGGAGAPSAPPVHPPLVIYIYAHFDLLQELCLGALRFMI